MRQCRECDVGFEPKHNWQLMCGSEGCKKSAQRSAQLRYKENHPHATRDATRKYRDANPEKATVWPSKRTTGIEIARLKVENPCTDCGNFFPYECMDFDHVGKDKKNNVGTMVAHGHNRDKIMAEIAKCELVCSNCHRTRTRKRRLASGKVPFIS